MRTRSIGLMAVLAAALACGRSALEPQELSLTLEADPTEVTVGQEVTFVMDVRGTRLLGLRMAYGDGEQSFDYLGIAGARSARWTNVHAYDEPGTYVAVARVDEVSDTLSRTVTITVNPVASAAVPAVARPFGASGR